MKNKIICSDVIVGLKQIPDGSVSLVFCSPPYDVKIDYGSHDDNMPWQIYLNWLSEVWLECKRVLKKGGRLAINIDAVTNRQDDKDTEYIRPIHYYLVNQMKQIGNLNFRGEIIWYKQNFVGRKTAWGSWCSSSDPILRRNFEYIFIWSKGQWRLEGDPEQSDMTSDEFKKWTGAFWAINAETRRMGKHPAPFPSELAYRIIKLYTYRGDIVLDPFNGSGTTTSVAASLHRRYIGIDNDPGYCNFARTRTKCSEIEVALDNSYVIRSERLKKDKNNKTITTECDIFE